MDGGSIYGKLNVLVRRCTWNVDRWMLGVRRAFRFVSHSLFYINIIVLPRERESGRAAEGERVDGDLAHLSS